MQQSVSEPIERWRSTGGTQPTAGYGTGATYDAWALNNEQGFTKRVPGGYVAGSKINVLLSETTAGVSLRHKWQADVSLIKADSDTPAAAAAETFTSEFVSPSAANRETGRTVAITDNDGQIDGITPAENDILTVKLSRVAATTNEDGNSINVISYELQTIVDQGAISGCLGRVGAIIDRVFDKYNEVDSEHLNKATILDYLNKCNAEIAKRDFWRTTTTLDAVTDQEAYDLFTLVPLLQRVLRVRWLGDTEAYSMPLCQTRGEYDQYKIDVTTLSITTGNRKCFIESGQLYIWPVPAGDEVDVIEVYHSEYPGDLGCASDYTPRVPIANDTLYECFALIEAAQKGSPASKAKSLLSMYGPKLDYEMNRLFSTQINQCFEIMPG